MGALLCVRTGRDTASVLEMWATGVRLYWSILSMRGARGGPMEYARTQGCWAVRVVRFMGVFSDITNELLGPTQQKKTIFITHKSTNISRESSKTRVSKTLEK